MKEFFNESKAVGLEFNNCRIICFDNASVALGKTGYLIPVIAQPSIVSCYFQYISLGFFFISPWC